MPITTSMIENERIFKGVITDPWTLDDLKACFVEDRRFREGVQHRHPIHTIMDVTQVKKVASHSLQARHSPSFSHPSRGHVVICGGTNLVTALGRTISQLAHFDQIKFFATEQEAMAYLRQLITDENRAASLTD